MSEKGLINGNDECVQRPQANFLESQRNNLMMTAAIDASESVINWREIKQCQIAKSHYIKSDS